MQRVRSEFDADKAEIHLPTAYRTVENRYELNCGMCGSKMFVDEVTKQRVEQAVEEGLEDNPFLCAECEAEYNDEMFSS